MRANVIVVIKFDKCSDCCHAFLTETRPAPAWMAEADRWRFLGSRIEDTDAAELSPSRADTVATVSVWHVHCNSHTNKTLNSLLRLQVCSPQIKCT